MLKLKKLQILGFKSFCDRTELKFHGEGIAAVVGPNGCGKSNISDAISWVLGEQSAKTLRGARMEDVIFAGTRERKPTGMAEVSLTLIDPQVYNGTDISDEAQVEIQDGFPTAINDDWDEAALREAAADDAAAATIDAQPGPAFVDGEQPIVATAERETPSAENGAETETTSSDRSKGVVLRIRRRKFAPSQLRTGEMVVTRRLFRSGESEYLMNGKLCRLRDIQDIFMGTGLGPESYAIIEQGRIGLILSSKPYDRRAIIEEAAGITKYKTRKRLAESRLEQAKLNLSRIHDIFEEVTRQMNSLKRQAAKAERYEKLRDEMREKLRIVLASKFSQLSEQARSVDEELGQVSELLRTKTEAVEHLDAAHAAYTQRGYEVDHEITAHHDRSNAIAIEVDRSSARSATNEERCAELQTRVVSTGEELARATEQMESLAQELATNRAVLDSAAADVNAAQNEAQLCRQSALQSAEAVVDVERQQESRRASLFDILSAANRTRNEITQTEENMASLDRESERLQREMAAASHDVQAMGGRRGQLGLEFESESQRVGALNGRIESVRAEIKERRNSETVAKQHLDSMRAEYATLQGKRTSLESVINEHGYSTETVKRLFQTGALGEGRAPVGVLADFLAVDDQYERVVEDFLREELNYIVVKSWDAADEGLRLLQTEADGRATFLVHPSDAQAKFSFVADESRRPAARDTIVPLTRCIQVLDGFGKSLEVILPKLRGGYIAPDARLARELALENPDAFYLAPNGETFHNVTVTGGKQRSEGPLSMKRELRDVLRMMGELERDMQSETVRIQTYERELNDLNGLLGRLEGELREAEKQAMTHGHALQQMESEIFRTEQRLNNYQVELQRVNSQYTQKGILLAAKNQELHEREAERLRTEAEIGAMQTSMAELKSAREAAGALAAEMSAKLAGLEERQRSAASSMQRIETLNVEVSGRVEALKTQIAAAHAEKEQRERQNVEIAERLIALAQEKQQTEELAAKLRAESELLRAQLAETEQELKKVRAEMDAARDRRGELAAIAAKLQSDFAHMGETCLNDLGIAGEALRADESLTILQGEVLAGEDANYREMRSRLDAMGPVNMMALEEYKETAERHGFLETQRKDLLDSIENTQSTIKEIDSISRQKFEEAFHIINENFQRTFHKLFGGGQGFMRLTDEENSSESGIDIVASPPGKKLQNVLLLSGGEKALTAISLLMGIFQYQPSPFCILDEVDAPLDESNVGRFADLVREMSSQTQFILITHSKRTMNAAPVMYGVTMQEPGVSKVVSVKFGEEPQLATA